MSTGTLVEGLFHKKGWQAIEKLINLCHISVLTPSSLSELTRREPQYGYTVVFHDHESYSSTIPSGFWMSPGAIYKVDLSLTQVGR